MPSLRQHAMAFTPPTTTTPFIDQVHALVKDAMPDTSALFWSTVERKYAIGTWSRAKRPGYTLQMHAHIIVPAVQSDERAAAWTTDRLLATIRAADDTTVAFVNAEPEGDFVQFLVGVFDAVDDASSSSDDASSSSDDASSSSDDSN